MQFNLFKCIDCCYLNLGYCYHLVRALGTVWALSSGMRCMDHALDQHYSYFVCVYSCRLQRLCCMQGEQTICDLLQYNWSCTFSWMRETVPTEIGIEYIVKILFIIFETLIIDQRSKHFYCHLK